MASFRPGGTLNDYQELIRVIYQKPDDLHFDLFEMHSNLERFAMRGLKGIRKGNSEKATMNFMISLSWFTSVLTRLHLKLEDVVWRRFPYICSYCGSLPCACKEQKVSERREISIDESKHPKTLKEFQIMFNRIYPAERRTLEHAGIHLAEEIGEFSEALLAYRGGHGEGDLQNVVDEAGDFFSCLMGVLNSLNVNAEKELCAMFDNNCYRCKEAPCECSFAEVVNFVS